MAIVGLVVSMEQGVQMLVYRWDTVTWRQCFLSQDMHIRDLEVCLHYLKAQQVNLRESIMRNHGICEYFACAHVIKLFFHAQSRGGARRFQ